jgi:hypothetical protein
MQENLLQKFYGTNISVVRTYIHLRYAYVVFIICSYKRNENYT